MVTTEELIQAKALLGHPKNFSNPKTRASRGGISGNSVTFDPATVIAQLEKGQEMIQEAIKNNHDILVLCEKEIYKEEIEALSTKVWFHYMNHKIPAGVLTNFDTLLIRIKSLQDMRSYLTSESYKSLTKKEQSMKKRELSKIEMVYKGVSDLRKKPGLVIIVDGQMMHKFVKEVLSTQTPAIILSSSNFDIHTSVHLVMGNVNSQRSIDLIMQTLMKGAHIPKETAKPSSWTKPVVATRIKKETNK